MNIQLRDNVIDKIIKIEGGYVDDPSDSGGETRYGVTVKVARQNGYDGDMKFFPLELAKKIYIDKYWNSLCLDEISDLAPSVAEELVDTGINMGVIRAAKFLQRSLNSLNNRGTQFNDLTVDGIIGKNTIRALEIYINVRGKEGNTVLVNMLNCLQGAFYIDLAERREKDEKFVYGWFKHRVTII